ncbi:MAG TPA: threonine/serine exporter family protein, partial [Bacillota bacterium]|nr:threonine/serine exporter family protein [Bacillota bacterium]
LAVGVACASFGRLLGVDWLGVGPVFVAAAIGQRVRRQLAMRHVNVFIIATLVAFVASALSGLVARWAGSKTVETAMTAAVLLLVPGVPSLNAQNDILEGRPTLGSARAVWVAVILVFLTIGVWLGQMLLGEGR